jgi:putative spermidine/putrescine transport system permease protein
MVLAALVFLAPFVGMLLVSLRASVRADAPLSVRAYLDLFEAFGGPLSTSVKVTLSTIAINLALALPAAYALARLRFMGRDSLLAVLNLALFVPPIVYGVALAITYPFLYQPLVNWLPGLVLAMAVGTYPLMLIPLITAIQGVPLEYEEAARSLGAGELRTFRKVVFPLIGPGLAGGILLTAIVVWNEFLVTLFVAGSNVTAPLLLYNRIAFYGIQPSTAALAVFMQVVSFIAIGIVGLALTRRAGVMERGRG